jgi:hypothetical protein
MATNLLKEIWARFEDKTVELFSAVGGKPGYFLFRWDDRSHARVFFIILLDRLLFYLGFPVTGRTTQK